MRDLGNSFGKMRLIGLCFAKVNGIHITPFLKGIRFRSSLIQLPKIQLKFLTLPTHKMSNKWPHFIEPTIKNSTLCPVNKPKVVHIVGAGYVGLTLGAYFLRQSDFKVVFIDNNSELIFDLRNGKIPVFEPNLREILEEAHIKGRVSYALDSDIHTVSILFICITTAKDSQSNPVFDYFEKAALRYLEADAKVFIRSTVLVGTASQVSLLLKSKDLNKIELYSCPERTAEGIALEEIEKFPQLLGVEHPENPNEKVLEILASLGLSNAMIGSWQEIEFAKLLCNVWRDYTFAFSNSMNLFALERSISFTNSIAIANRDYPRASIPSPGPVGGPCLTKDTYLLGKTSSKFLELSLSARRWNEIFEEQISSAIYQFVEILSPVRIIVAGLAFKGHPVTNDFRNSFGKDLLYRFSTSGFSTKLAYWDPIVELSDFSRIHNLEELSSLPPNSVIIVANNNHTIANFINEKKKSSWKTSNLSIVDIGGLIRNTDELFELINLGNLKL